MAREISGTAVAVTASGFVLLYSAIKNVTITKTLHSFLAGSPVVGVSPGSYIGGGGVSGGVPDLGVPSGPQGGNEYTTILAYLRSKGFTKAAIAGILGNMEVESGFNPASYNAGEGAIGICQWEHGRRVALQEFARTHGSTETDINMQLGYMWLELHSAFAHVLLQIQSVSSPSLAAAIWDSQYEISSGAARTERENNAIRIYASL